MDVIIILFHFQIISWQCIGLFFLKQLLKIFDEGISYYCLTFNIKLIWIRGPWILEQNPIL